MYLGDRSLLLIGLDILARRTAVDTLEHGDERLDAREAVLERGAGLAHAVLLDIDERVLQPHHVQIALEGLLGSRLEVARKVGRRQSDERRDILEGDPLAVVILDEATAALDTRNEYLIHQAISNLCAGKTVIVIAHTLRNIKNADEIIVLDHGEIRERGCHSELMKLDGKYAYMYELQKKSLVWEVCQAACSTDKGTGSE